MTHELQVYAHVLGRIVDELLEMNGVLCDDAQEINKLLSRDWGSQTTRRTYVRACWAYIEATTHGIKEAVLCASTLGSAELPARDQIFLAGVSYLVSSDGSTAVKAVRCDTEKNIKHTLRIAAECFDVGWKPEFGDQAWRMLKTSLSLRHRLMHPKSAAKLNVSDKEFSEHQEAFLWFSALYTKLIKDMHNRFNTKNPI